MSFGNILVISHNFPPLQGAESLLVGHNVSDLRRRGWKVGVVTSPTIFNKAKTDRSLLEKIPGDVDVLRTSWNGELVCPQQSKMARYALGWVGSRILPCPSLFWKEQAVKLALKWVDQQNGTPSIIYSRAPRHVSSLAAKAVRVKTGLPWVAHFSDPWYDFSYDGMIHRAWILRLEREVINEAEALVFPNEKLAEKVMAKYKSSLSNKVHIISHGFTKFYPEDVKTAFEQPLWPLKAIHAGAFYPVFRTPDNLFKGLALLNSRLPLKGKLILGCVGDETTCFQSLVEGLGLSEIVLLRDSLPYEKCQEKIKEADLLIVVDVTHGLRGVFLPTKLVEYYAFQKPILGITPKESAVEQSLKECGQYYADQDSPEAIAIALEEIIKSASCGRLSVSPDSKRAMARYYMPTVNDQLDLLFKSLL